MDSNKTVSYTHLDVYKRQTPDGVKIPCTPPHGLSAEQVSSTSDALLMEQNALRN